MNFAHRLPWGHPFANENIQVGARKGSVLPRITQPVSWRVGAAPSSCSAQEGALPALLPGAGASCANTARPAVPVRAPPAQHHPVIKPKSSTLFCLLNFHPDCPFFQPDCSGQKPREDIAHWHNFLLHPKLPATFLSLSCHPPLFPVFPYLSSDLSEKVSR